MFAGPPQRKGLDFSDLNAQLERMREQALRRPCEYCKRQMFKSDEEWICKNCGFRKPL